jgi:hypothetical protein
VAFAELCYRAEAHEGGTPSERQIRAFRRAMQRTDLTHTAANTGTAAPELAQNHPSTNHLYTH